jgi:recombination protein RecA
MVKAKKKTPKEEIDRFEGGDYEFFTKELGRQYEGGVSVMDVGDLPDPDKNSTGSLTLDFDLAIPFPEGAVIELYGGEGSGKTSLALQALAEALQNGKHCLFVDAERSLNRRHMSGIQRIRPWLQSGYQGPNGNTLKVVKTTTGEQALQTMRMFASQFPKGVVVLDSVDACLPEALLTGDIGEQKIGNHAKLMSDALRKLVGIANDNGVTLIFVNQLRSKIIAYGDPNETSGGRALKFYAHQRIELLKPGKAQIMTDPDGDRIGVIMRYKIIKNKYNPFGQEGEIPILYGYGFYDAQELMNMCLKFGILNFGGKGGGQVKMPKWEEVPRVDDKGKPVFLRSNPEEQIIDRILHDGEDECVAKSKNIASKMFANDRELYLTYYDRLTKLLSGEGEGEDGIQDTE